MSKVFVLLALLFQWHYEQFNQITHVFCDICLFLKNSVTLDVFNVSMVGNIILSAVREVVSRDEVDLHRSSQYVIKGAQILSKKKVNTVHSL